MGLSKFHYWNKLGTLNLDGPETGKEANRCRGKERQKRGGKEASNCYPGAIYLKKKQKTGGMYWLRGCAVLRLFPSDNKIRILWTGWGRVVLGMGRPGAPTDYYREIGKTRNEKGATAMNARGGGFCALGRGQLGGPCKFQFDGPAKPGTE